LTEYIPSLFFYEFIVITRFRIQID
jgi:hypothetical protein